MWRVDSLEKTDAGRDWGWEEKGTTEDEMAGWHHCLNGRESEWTPGVGDGQGGLACCDSWGHKESDTTEQLNWTELGKLSSGHRTGKVVFIPIPKKGNPKECSNYHTIALISHSSKVLLKILQAGFSNMWTVNLQMYKLVIEKAEEPEIKLPTSSGSSKKQESSRKISISALLTMPKPLTVWIAINCGKFWKTWEYQTTRPASWETYMQVRKQQLELDMDQQTGSK